MANGSRQWGPMALSLEADNPEPSPVLGEIVVDGWRSHVLAVAALKLQSPHQVRVHIETNRVRALSQERCGDHLALAGRLAGDESGADHGRARHPHGVVAHAAALERWLAV